MKMIKLTNTNKVALVDDNKYEEINAHKWRLDSQGYALRGIRENGVYRNIRMHRLLNNTPAGFDTDHINRNKLDNRISNLRTATRQENRLNSKVPTNNQSGFTGVSWSNRYNKWLASYRRDGKHKWVGLFDDPRKANEAIMRLIK